MLVQVDLQLPIVYFGNGNYQLDDSLEFIVETTEIYNIFGYNEVYRYS